jgi:hypothetical protein
MAWSVRIVISKVIPTMFHTAEGRNLMADAGCRISSAVQRLQSVSRSPQLGLSRQLKNCIGCSEAETTCSVAGISPHGMGQLTCRFTCPGFGGNEGSQ